MPFLNVSRAIRNPMFADSFQVKRRKQTIGSNGRTVVSATILSKRGVVCATNPADLERLDDNQRMGRHLSIVTEFRLFGPAKDSSSQQYQPDIIVWRGDNYIVQSLEPYTSYGPGFVEAIVGSIDSIDFPAAQEVLNLWAMNFSAAGNAGNCAVF